MRLTTLLGIGLILALALMDLALAASLFGTTTLVVLSDAAHAAAGSLKAAMTVMR